LNDSTFAAVIKIQDRSGYFTPNNNSDNSTWIVKLNKNYKIISKTLIDTEFNYNTIYTFDPVTKSVCVVNRTIGGYDQIANIKVYSLQDATLKLTVPTDNDTAYYTTQNIRVNPSGGFCFKFTIRHPAGNDSLRVVVIDSALQLWCNKVLPTDYFDTTYTILDSINLSLVDNHQWMSELYFDNNYLYAASFVHDNSPVFIDGKTAFIMHKLDKNLTIKNMKVLGYNDSTASFQIVFNSGVFFKLKNYIVYRDNKSSFSAAFYLFDTSLNLIRKIIPPNNQNRIHRYFFSEFISGGKLFIPVWFNYDNYLSYFYSYDENFNLIHIENLDSIFDRAVFDWDSPNIINHYTLEDSSMILLVSGIYNGITNRHYMKVDKDGKKIWVCPMSDTYKWKGKLLKTAPSFSDYPLSSFVIEKIAGKERAFIDYMTCVDYSFGYQKDTIVLVQYKVDLDNGKIIDSNIIASALTTSSDKTVLFNYAKKTDNDEYALMGTSNQLCTGRNVDIFSAIASRNYNTIVSRVFLDFNSNSILDNNEHYLSNVSIGITKNNTTTESYFSANGYIINFTDTGKYVIKVNHNYNYYTASPDSVLKNYTTFGNTDTLNFALQPIANVNDLMVQLNNNGRGRPGFNGSYILNVINNGTTFKNAIAKLKLSDNIDSIFSIPSATVNNDTLYWTFNNMEPSEQRIVELYFHYKEPPLNNIGDTLISTAMVLPMDNDTFPDNNISILQDVLSGSYDPNDKTTDKTEYTSDDISNKEYIKYTIRFENTGNDTAFSIVIVDTLDINLDVATFMPLNGKYSYSTKITKGNILTFTFNPIRLPEHTTSSVSYLIKPKNSLLNGLTIKNKASIKFDYNEPIITNNTQTKISIISEVQNNKNTLVNFKLFPNPAKEEITIEFNNVKAIRNIQVVDILGHVIKDIAINMTDRIINLNIHELHAGSYVLNVIDRNNSVQSVKFLITK
jgi:uncharacterized repeat protein (TIGR01451 family)